ncbi:hypothetical protein SAMN02799622_04594 [Methylobacterium sp. UNC378MF]|uniref:hypothetical protein n=1 Tax=Methylobacterium sp. UNC378MF TaxID=1502748 RepID=UPI0008821C9A|nr:hypothetical protein [Methylobacterium sp. UNC378MF]SDA29942.1 hypothetical protein SAMN02799622_04594 [Methylobacterium sp. UNC378MF]
MTQNPADPKPSARPNLRSFSANADRNGQDLGQDEARDLGRPAELERERQSDPSWEAEVARIASGQQRLDAVGGGSMASVEATEAETPPENLRHLGDASTGPRSS